MSDPDETTSSRLSALTRRLDLSPHPEGGFYRERFRSPHSVRAGERTRAALTHIDFVLGRNDRSRWHVVASDEVWNFYDGIPLELFEYDPHSDSLTRHLLSGESGQGARSATIPAGHWQAARPSQDDESDEEYAWVGCTVGPGFDFEDFALLSDLELSDRWPTSLSTLRSLL